MAENSPIEWTDHTFNPWIGCTKVSPGCDNCYAAVSTPARSMHIAWGAGEQRHRTAESTWGMPKRWNDRHEAFYAQHGRRQRVFCASLADVFDNQVPHEWRRDLFNLILSTPSLDWMLLTKRIGNAARMVEEILPDNMKALPADCPVAWPWPNVWIGATVVNQEEADRDIPKLLATPAAVRFLSMEPLLGPVDLTGITVPRAVGAEVFSALSFDGDADDAPDLGTATLDWVIVGGESGPHARPMHPDWARSIRDQCAAAGVPFLFKQHGDWAPGSGDFGAGRLKTAAISYDGSIVVPGGFTRDAYPVNASSADGWAMVHWVGKKKAGRLLDGRTHDEFPR